ncbi:ECF transporter S component [Lentilactobacillus sp. G22-6]|uniref:ECF transporter S component n=1 Tax=Lentilactobacillus dabitei TaxID=2831523 RepID=UPI001C27174C|nr:ECF transporter S component [Lentilactobacillus dabitei]MBU9788631.1 ECF transporter S component [Lentilactobacillus dabitei]
MKVLAKWHLRDIITIAIISVLFGFIFVFSDWLYTLVYGILSPLGLGPFVGEGLFGLWCMGGPIAFMVVRLPGSSLISEILGAFLGSGMGGQFGITALFAGFFQGLGSELGFASFRYKRFDVRSLLLAAVLSTVVTFGSALFIHGYIKLKLLMMLALFLTRLVSNLIFSVGLVSLIHNLFTRAHTFETRKS